MNTMLNITKKKKKKKLAAQKKAEREAQRAQLDI